MNPPITTSRYSNPALIDAEAAGWSLVRVTLSPPRWPLKYEVPHRIASIAPTRAEFRIPDDDEFVDTYRGRIDQLGVDHFRPLLEEVAGPNGLVLLCYEDVRVGKLCHRRVWADWWTERTGEPVEEYPDPSVPRAARNAAATPAPPTLF